MTACIIHTIFAAIIHPAAELHPILKTPLQTITLRYKPIFMEYAVFYFFCVILL